MRQVFGSRRFQRTLRSSEQQYCQRCGCACVLDSAGGRLRPRCPECGFVIYRNPLPGVAVVVKEGPNVVLGLRSKGARFAGKWALPAGFIEFDEDFLTAAIRETKEETGLQITVTGIVNVSTNYLAEDLQCLVIVVAAKPIGGKLKAGDDFCEAKWFSLKSRLPPMAYEADVHLLGALKSGAVPALPVHRRSAKASSPAFERLRGRAH
jgi:8-oxo-dGTP diphosphatase